MGETESGRRGRLSRVFRVREVSNEVTETVPKGLRITAAYAWRFVALAAAIGIVIWLIIQLKLIVIPLMVAILLTALLTPAMSFMLSHRFPKWLAVVTAVVGTLVIVAALLTLSIWQIGLQWPSVEKRGAEVFGQVRDYLVQGPLQLTAKELDQGLAQVGTFIQDQASALLSGALAIGSTIGHVATGAVLALFILIMLLADGGVVWGWIVRLFPSAARVPIDGAGRAGWKTLVSYTRTQLLVATIDAVGIGAGALLLGVPLALPVAILVFLGAFVPIVGAFITGFLAVLLALVYNGLWVAVWMLIVVIAVQEIEGHVLQPLLMGSAVKVHPLAIVLSIAAGTLIAGIPGALFAVPVAAFINVVAIYFHRRSWETGKAPRSDHMIWTTEPRTRKANA